MTVIAWWVVFTECARVRERVQWRESMREREREHAKERGREREKGRKRKKERERERAGKRKGMAEWGRIVGGGIDRDRVATGSLRAEKCVYIWRSGNSGEV